MSDPSTESASDADAGDTEATGTTTPPQADPAYDEPGDNPAAALDDDD
jgi:hypothetical protein